MAAPTINYEFKKSHSFTEFPFICFNSIHFVGCRKYIFLFKLLTFPPILPPQLLYWVEGVVIPVHAMKEYVGVVVERHSFLTFTVDAGE
jgi:hypothetical protein